MANPYTKVTPQMEQQNKYYEAHKKWKKEKPTSKSMFNNQMGALGSDIRNNNQAKLDKATADWKAREPKKSDFTSTSAPSAPAPTTPAPTSTPPKTGESTRQTTTSTAKEEGKINNDLKSVNQRGVASFVRSLLPSKDRLSPSQRFEKRKGRKENYGERKRRRG